jgi:hypothetical protein
LLGNRGFSCARQTAEDYQHWHAALCLWLLGNLYDVAFQIPLLEGVRALLILLNLSDIHAPRT